MIAICKCGRSFIIPDGEDSSKYTCECGNQLPAAHLSNTAMIQAEITRINIPFMRLLDLVFKVCICVIISAVLLGLLPFLIVLILSACGAVLF